MSIDVPLFGLFRLSPTSRTTLDRIRGFRPSPPVEATGRSYLPLSTEQRVQVV